MRGYPCPCCDTYTHMYSYTHIDTHIYITSMYIYIYIRLLLQWIKSISPKNIALLWRHNGLDSVSNHQPHHCLLGRLFGRRSKITSKLRVTGLCARNSPGTGEFPAQMASYAENVSIWWRHHGWIQLHARALGSYLWFVVPWRCVSRALSHNSDLTLSHYFQPMGA